MEYFDTFIQLEDIHADFLTYTFSCVNNDKIAINYISKDNQDILKYRKDKCLYIY